MSLLIGRTVGHTVLETGIFSKDLGCWVSGPSGTWQVGGRSDLVCQLRWERCAICSRSCFLSGVDRGRWGCMRRWIHVLQGKPCRKRVPDLPAAPILVYVLRALTLPNDERCVCINLAGLSPRNFLVQLSKFLITSLESLPLFHKSGQKMFDMWKMFFSAWKTAFGAGLGWSLPGVAHAWAIAQLPEGSVNHFSAGLAGACADCAVGLR